MKSKRQIESSYEKEETGEMLGNLRKNEQILEEATQKETYFFCHFSSLRNN